MLGIPSGLYLYRLQAAPAAGKFISTASHPAAELSLSPRLQETCPALWNSPRGSPEVAPGLLSYPRTPARQGEKGTMLTCCCVFSCLRRWAAAAVVAHGARLVRPGCLGGPAAGVLTPGMAASASCIPHAPCLRLRATHSRLALLGLAGAGGRRLWRHPADRVLRAVCRWLCGGVSAAVLSGWGGLKTRARTRDGRDWRRPAVVCLLRTPYPSAPAWCPRHHHFPVLLFLICQMMLPHPPLSCPSSFSRAGKGEGLRGCFHGIYSKLDYWLPANAVPLCPARCPRHHHFPVLPFILYQMMLPHSPCPVLHHSRALTKERG